MELPPPLRPFAPYLGFLRAELAPAFAPLVARAHRALGPLRSATDDQGIPDGYAGLARRGPLSRLLPSEWMFLDAEPDELVRRHAMGELGYLALARERPRARRVSVALFETGPRQLGPPRLFHLAVLVAMGRRAREAGAAVAFGALGDAPGPPVDEIGPYELSRLLHLRARTPLPPDAVERSLVALGFAGLPLDDVWLVGAPETLGGEAARRFGRVLVREALATDALEVEVRRGAERRAAFTLELPREVDGARLLSGSFDRDLASASPAPRLVFGPRAGELLVRATPDLVFGYSTAAPDRPVTALETPAAVVAMGFFENRPALLRHEEGRLALDLPTAERGRSRRAFEFALEPRFRFAPPDPPELLEVVSAPGKLEGLSVLLVLDRAGTLFGLALGRGAAFPIAERVLAVGLRRRSWFYVAAEALPGRVGADWRVVGVVPGAAPLELARGSGTPRVLLGPPERRAPLGRRFAIEVGPGHWFVPAGLLRVPPGGEALGFSGDAEGIVWLDPDRRRFWTQRVEGPARVELEAPAPVEAAAVHPVAQLLAFSTRGARVFAFPLRTGALVELSSRGAR